MKKLLFFFSLLIFSQYISAQSKPYTKSVTMSLGTHSAIVVDISDIEADEAIDMWSSYMKKYGKMKRNKKAGEYYAMGANVPLISSSKIDVYSSVEDLKGSSRLYVWIDKGGAFLTEDNDKAMHSKAEKFIYDFGVSAEKQLVENMLEKAEKNLKSLAKEQKTLEKDKKSYISTIEEAKSKIEKFEKKIEINGEAQIEKKKLIDDAQKAVEKIKERLKNVGKN